VGKRSDHKKSGTAASPAHGKIWFAVIIVFFGPSYNFFRDRLFEGGFQLSS
jgi:hypothetical protein